MSDQISNTLSLFVNHFKELVDPDEGTTLARISPILGDLLNVSSLVVVSKFLTEFFFESLDPSNDSYVVLSGVRLPLTMFPILEALRSTALPGELRRVADALAAQSTGAVYPAALVDVCAFYGNGNEAHILSNDNDEARYLAIEAIEAANLLHFAGDTTEPSLSTSISEVERASVKTDH